MREFLYNYITALACICIFPRTPFTYKGGKWKNNGENDTSYFSKNIYMFNNSKRKWVLYDDMVDNSAFSSIGSVNLEEMKPFCKNT